MLKIPRFDYFDAHVHHEGSYQRQSNCRSDFVSGANTLSAALQIECGSLGEWCTCTVLKSRTRRLDDFAQVGLGWSSLEVYSCIEGLDI
jgi:hypothetical protein